MAILNLTTHKATPEQTAQGLVEPGAYDKQRIRELLRFDEKPDRTEIVRRAQKLAEIAFQYQTHRVMIGGALWLMSALETALRNRGMCPCYAFSKRRVEERERPDGSVEKVITFVHEGFVEV